MRISDWSSDVCSSDLNDHARNIRSARALNRTVISLGGATALEFGGFLNVKSLYQPIFQVIDYETVDWGGFTRLTGEAGSVGGKVGVRAQFGTVDARQYVNMRTEERRVGKECDSTCRSRGWRKNIKKKKKKKK